MVAKFSPRGFRRVSMPDLIELVEKLADAFERLQLRYVLGGALAASYWGTPRATEDIDCLIALPALKYQLLADELGRIGVALRDTEGGFSPITVPRMRDQAQNDNLIECFFDSVRVELFLPAVPLQEEILRRAVKVPINDREYPLTTAEDLILLKMAFHRPKDIMDVRSILWVQRGWLDLAYIRNWSLRSHDAATQQELEQLIGRYSTAEPT
jgi:predicted nucleotidyltransferase